MSEAKEGSGMLTEAELRAEFEFQHEGRNLKQHRLRGTYVSAPIAALWNQHKRTAIWMQSRALAAAAAPAPIALPEPQAARPVTPLTCPKCGALWLHWPKEQSGFEHDSLNMRGAKSCNFCEHASADQLKSLNRVAPSASPAALTDGEIWEAADKIQGLEDVPDRVILNLVRAIESRMLAASPADQVEDAHKLLTAASHALRSYQYGNAAPDLAESIADRIDAAMSTCKEVK